MEKKRSIGVMVFGVILLIVSSYAIITGIFLCKKLISNYYVLDIETFTDLLVSAFIVSIEDIVYSFILLLFAILCVFLGIGILRLTNRARILFLTIATGFLVFCIYATFISPSLIIFNTVLLIPFYILPVLCITGLIFLTRPKIKEQFKK